MSFWIADHMRWKAQADTQANKMSIAHDNFHCPHERYICRCQDLRNMPPTKFTEEILLVNNFLTILFWFGEITFRKFGNVRDKRTSWFKRGGKRTFVYHSSNSTKKTGLWEMPDVDVISQKLACPSSSISSPNRIWGNINRDWKWH